MESLPGDLSITLRPRGFPGGSDGKESAYSAGDPGLIPGSEDPLEKGNPLQYSCLKNSMDRGDWWATVHGVAKNQTQLSHIYTETPTPRVSKCVTNFSIHYPRNIA